MMPVVVAVCSQDPLIVLGVRELLRDEEDIVVAPASQLAGAHVALVAADELDAASLDVVTRIARSSAARTILIVNQVRDTDLAVLVRCRVVRVIARQSVSAELLLDSVRAAAADAWPGGVVRLTEQLERMSRDLLTPKAGAAAALLAPRERALLKLLADGMDTAEIAEELAYSVRAVKNIVQGLLTRLGLRNRAHAVAYAMRAGVL